MHILTRVKKPNEKINFSWNKSMVGIEYFLPGNVYNDNEINIPDKPYNFALDENMLSKIGLKINDTNLCDLINKQDDQSANQSDTTLIDEDDNLKIEEKFVKYCTVNTISTITIHDKKSFTKNNILNTFAIKYSNCNQMDEIIVNQKEAELKDVNPSTSFLNTAIASYQEVADFVDTQEITNAADSSKKLSLTIKIENWIMVAEIVLIVIIEILFYFFAARPWELYFKYIKVNMVTIAIFLATIAITLYMVWYFGVAGPISSQAEKIKNWNNAITKKTKYSDIRVLNKIGDDKDNFKSSDVLNKSFTTNPAKTFASCFYYFHFNNFLLNDDENTNDINKQIKDDYDQFNETKKDYDVTIDKDCFKWILAIIFAIVLIVFLLSICFLFFIFHDLRLQLWTSQQQAVEEKSIIIAW